MNDDELLGALEAVLHCEPAEPSAASVNRLRAQVIHPGSPITSRRWANKRRRVFATAAAALVVFGAGSVAYAGANDALPAPIRQAGRAIGLPIESPDLSEARRVERQLHDAIIRGDRSAIDDQARRLRELMDSLPEPDRDRIPEARAELEDVQRSVETPARESHDPSNGSTPASSAAVTEEPGGETTSTGAPTVGPNGEVGPRETTSTTSEPTTSGAVPEPDINNPSTTEPAPTTAPTEPTKAPSPTTSVPPTPTTEPSTVVDPGESN